MARFSRPIRARRAAQPEVPYYAEGELVRERTVIETVDEAPPAVVRGDSDWLWLLLIPLVLLLVLGAYFLGRDGDDDPAVVNETPTVQPTVVVTQAPAAPPVVVNPPPVVVTQAPAPEQSTAPGTPAPSPS